MLAVILRGKQNGESKAAKKATRMAMTINVMKLLRCQVIGSGMDMQKKMLLWAISCIAFNGSFRIHELTPCLSENVVVKNFSKSILAIFVSPFLSSGTQKV